MYNRFRSAHRSVNVIFAAYNDALKRDIQVMMSVQQSEGSDKSFATCFQPSHGPHRTVDASDLER